MWLRLPRRGSLALILILAVCGCGKGLVLVQGVITVDGKPVHKATVRFLPVDGSPRLAFGLTDDNGNFQLTTYEAGDGILPGEYKVVITSEENTLPVPLNPDDTEKAWGQWMKAMQEMKQRPPKPKVLPVIYGELATTPLRWRVPADGRVAVFELRSGAAPAGNR